MPLKSIYGGGGQTAYHRSGNGSTGGRVLERVKSISYSATINSLLLDVEVDQTEGSVKTGRTGNITIANTGTNPAYAILAYRLWTTATAMSATTYHVNYLLAPGERIYIPDAPAIISDGDIEQITGTVITDLSPDDVNSGNEYIDSGADIDDGTGADIIGSASETKVFLEPYTSATNCTGNLFRIGDVIKINSEYMDVVDIGDKSDAANNYLTVRRGAYGSTAASDHADDAQVEFAFFNIYGGNYNRYSTCQTDAGGRLHISNLMGYGRALTRLDGITPGSIAIKFYSEGAYQELTNDGDITATTNSGLSASTTYYLSISIDGVTTDKITFLTDSSNVNFGGSNGITTKLQDAIDELYYNPAKNNYEKGATVSIVNGDLRITSNQNLSSSAISVTTNSDGTAGTDELFDTSNVIGRFPATIPAAVSAYLPDDNLFDLLTNEAIPNISEFGTDDGFGRFGGKCGGTINYDTGEMDIVNAPPNAEWVISFLHTSAFSGRIHATDASKMNALKAIYGNTPDQKLNAELTITRE